MIQDSVRIIHLGQRHSSEFDKHDLKNKDYVIESQLKIANYIKEHPNALVFVEWQTKNCNKSNNFKSSCFSSIFPNGIPENSAELNKLQKGILADILAPNLMRSIGKLDDVYKVISAKQSAIIHTEIRKNNYTFLFNEVREKAAMKSIKKILKKILRKEK